VLLGGTGVLVDVGVTGVLEGRGVLLGGTGVLVGDAGTGVLEGRGVLLGGTGVLVDVGVTGVLEGRGVLLGGTGVLVGDAGTGVLDGRGVLLGDAGVLVGDAGTGVLEGREVLLGGTGVLDASTGSTVDVGGAGVSVEGSTEMRVASLFACAVGLLIVAAGVGVLVALLEPERDRMIANAIATTRTPKAAIAAISSLPISRCIRLPSLLAFQT
jgi:hypothetical protein